MKTIFYSTHGFDRPYLEKEIKNKNLFTFTSKALSKETVNLAKEHQIASLFTSDDASAEVLESLQKIGVKYLALRSAGHDHVDLKKCHEFGITVANVPQYSPYSVAEHAMTLILCLNRKIKQSQELIKQNDFRLDDLVGFEMKGKTIGIIGTGKIGAIFAQIASGFGCNLLACDTIENEELKQKLQIKYVALDELCKNSDIITLHCPLNDSTKHLLNKDNFWLMKNNVMIINTARGAVINTKDLLVALENKTVAAAGLDVYEFEKNLFFEKHEGALDDELFNLLQKKPNVIITGHQAFLTEEALSNIVKTTIYNIDCFAKNQKSENEI